MTRLHVVFVLLALLPVAVLGKMVHIHLTDGPELRRVFMAQANTVEILPATRGSIYDAEGRALAVNTARYEVALDPTVPGFTERADEFFATLAEVTGRSEQAWRQRVNGRSSPQYVLLARSMSQGAVEQLRALGVPGLIAKGDYGRRYTYGSLAAHLLGHVDPDLHGKAGLELQYDALLKGTPGHRSIQRDRSGGAHTVVGGRATEPEAGEDLVLTIDLVRQSILEAELARGVQESGAAWGTAIAMDVHTGAILGMANVPTYNPNRPGGVTEASRRNHAIADQVEPGSTFKLVSAIAALQARTVALTDTVDTGQGYIRRAGHDFHDSHGYGRIPFSEAIAKSSNVAFVRVADTMDDGALYEVARNLGFGQPTWIDLPGETAGVLHAPEDWSRSTRHSMSIGYSVAVTPLQMLTAYAALANGGLLVSPYVVQQRLDLRGRVLWDATVARRDSVRRAFDAETAAALLPAFEQVVAEDGTAQRAAVDGLRIAGKTGTARTVVDGRYARAYRATFVGVFPADQPEVALLVLMDRPTNGYYGGAAAAPVFSRVAERWIGTFPSIAAHVAPPGTLPERDTTVVPPVEAMPARLAERRLLADGLWVRKGRGLNDWQPVTEQTPTAAARQRADRPVRLASTVEPVARTEDATMPDLTGLSARQATSWLAALGVAVRLDGSGAVRRQDPEPGASLPRAALLTCR
ncbi:MAG: penicillin-binding transpeptidase domain-containing protein [Bacteroidota bacterium]